MQYTREKPVGGKLIDIYDISEDNWRACRTDSVNLGSVPTDEKDASYKKDAYAYMYLLYRMFNLEWVKFQIKHTEEDYSVVACYNYEGEEEMQRVLRNLPMFWDEEALNEIA